MLNRAPSSRRLKSYILPRHPPARARMCCCIAFGTPAFGLANTPLSWSSQVKTVPVEIPTCLRSSSGMVVVPLLVTFVSFLMVRILLERVLLSMDDTNMQSQVPLLWIKDCLQRVPRILECLAAMQATSSQREIIQVTGLSNQEFLARYAGPGRLGLSGGITLIDKAICRAQRHLSDDEEWGWWSHAFVFQGERPDGHQWVIESDLLLHHKHIQFGAQENRVSKYYDEKLYRSPAVLDFALSPAQCAALVKEGLELIANRTRYSVRELVGTLIARRITRAIGN